MAASGGFWAKGGFFTATEVAVLEFNHQDPKAWYTGPGSWMGLDMIKGFAYDDIMAAAYGDDSTPFKKKILNAIGQDAALKQMALYAKQKQDNVEKPSDEVVSNIEGQAGYDEVAPAHMEKASYDWAMDLDHDQVTAIKTYTDTGYGMNDKLRAGQSADQLAAGPYPFMKDLDSALEKADHLPKCMAYRAFNSTAIHTAAANGVLTKGTSLIDKGYMSTSAASKGAEEFAWGGDNQVFYRIRVPQGTKGAGYIDPLSSNKTEYEILFKRGYDLKVISVTMGSVAGNDNVAIIDLQA